MNRRLTKAPRPDEVATGVVFLAWDDNSHITGIELFADGTFAQMQAVNSGGGNV